MYAAYMILSLTTEWAKYVTFFWYLSFSPVRCINIHVIIVYAIFIR